MGVASKRVLRSFRGLAIGGLAFAATAAAPLAATVAPGGSAWPFIENGGRFTDEVAFATSTRHGTVYVTRDGRLITDFLDSGGAAAPARIHSAAFSSDTPPDGTMRRKGRGARTSRR